MSDLLNGDTNIPDEKNHPEIRPTLDQMTRVSWAQVTGGLSPVSLINTFQDWALHLAASPTKQMKLVEKATLNMMHMTNYMLRGGLDDTTEAHKGADGRFAGEAWRDKPFDIMAEAFIQAEDWWQEATNDIPGLSDADEKAISFLSRQILDAMSPSNMFWTNPEVLEATAAEGGANLTHGLHHYTQDQMRHMGKVQETEAETFILGQDLAATPGKVVFRNHLIELIRYTPTTDLVKAEPILITPAWIMKYYILDLRPENSMVKFLVEQGFTVFMISWRNPDATDRDLTMEDYLFHGPIAAMEEVLKQTKSNSLHAAGYCLGGTLLSVAAAYLAREGKDVLKSLSLFTAQTDFTEAGELNLFINESQLAFLEDIMNRDGYLSGKQMSGAFQMLRSNDLVWSQQRERYLMGRDTTENDLMFWNADQTRMPARMHSEYLRKLFLHNDLASNRYDVQGHPISLRDIRCPIFAVGTERDHVAPWKSAFKIHHLTHSDVTFVLTKGGHNAGIVSEPGHPRRSYQVRTLLDQDPAVPVQEWAEGATFKEGSWWLEWGDWVAEKSPDEITPPKMGMSLCDAPGTYIFQK